MAEIVFTTTQPRLQVQHGSVVGEAPPRTPAVQQVVAVVGVPGREGRPGPPGLNADAASDPGDLTLVFDNKLF